VNLVLALMLLAAQPAPSPAASEAHSAHAAVSTPHPDSGAELVGRPAPAWSFTRWVRGPVRSLADLRGKVVLLRWWTEGCHYCETTLPVLESLRERYPDLVIVGVFHAKPAPREVSDRRILALADTLGFGGPIAFDRDWTTLGRYWLDGHPERSWTSVSFLVDRHGVLRWVHGGGEYHPAADSRHHRCNLRYQELEAALAELLEPAPAN